MDFKELEKLVNEHNELLDKVNAKWDKIYETIENMIVVEQYNGIGSLIVDSMDFDVVSLDPIEQMKINFVTLKTQIEELSK